MNRVKDKFKSIRIKLFVTLCIVVVIIIAFLILTNNFVLESFYLYSKQKNLISVYEKINNYYKNEESNINIELELEKVAINNNFDIVIKDYDNISIYSSNRDFLSAINKINAISAILANNKNIIYQNEQVMIKREEEAQNGLTNILFNAKLVDV